MEFWFFENVGDWKWIKRQKKVPGTLNFLRSQINNSLSEFRLPASTIDAIMTGIKDAGIPVSEQAPAGGVVLE